MASSNNSVNNNINNSWNEIKQELENFSQDHIKKSEIEPRLDKLFNKIEVFAKNASSEHLEQIPLEIQTYTKKFGSQPKKSPQAKIAKKLREHFDKLIKSSEKKMRPN